MPARDVDLVVVEDEEEAARLVAQRLTEAAGRGEQIVLTGGSSPRRAYELAAELDAEAWRRAHLWWGDERCVPPDDELSNFGMAKQALLDRLPEPPASMHRIRGELGPDPAAAEYDALLDGVRLDLVLLGIGPDGHVASLFPNAPTLQERERRAIPAEPGLEPFVERVTMTLPVLCSAPEVLFLVAGESKAEAAARAFAGDPSPSTPSSLVRSASGRTTAILDRGAAFRLAV
ncbi:MAG: 6-phosphogluconolactonase [Gaiellaceae bacterium]|jgi:6-phosphogluconolactonase|nr:6-phosphogluconolactonase [Gaiellaceae bacterium]